ncbi:MAG: 50S ribosomal protein L10 [Planctomycetota bacterium]
MSRTLKNKFISELSERYKNVDSYIFVGYKGLNAMQSTELRKSLRKDGIEFNVIKNSAARLALEKTGRPELAKFLDGPTALIFPNPAGVVRMESVILSKQVMACRAKNAILEIRGGYLEGQIYSLDAIKRLAALPSRSILLAQLAGVCQAPLSNLARALNGLIQKLAGGLQALTDKRASETNQPALPDNEPASPSGGMASPTNGIVSLTDETVSPAGGTA